MLRHPPGRDPAPRYGTGTVLVAVGPGPVVTVRDPDGRELDVLRLAEDVGRPAAVNRAVAALPPDVGRVVLADPGTAFRPGALDALAVAADRHPRAGLLAPHPVGGQPASAGADPLPSAGADPLPPAGADPLPPNRAGQPSPVRIGQSRPGGAGQPSGGRRAGSSAAGRPPAGLLVARLVGGPSRRRRSRGTADRLPTRGALLRRSALDSVDGLRPVADPDADLCERLVRAGWLVLDVPSAEVAIGPA